jgi:hypothetical protein
MSIHQLITISSMNKAQHRQHCLQCWRMNTSSPLQVLSYLNIIPNIFLNFSCDIILPTISKARLELWSYVQHLPWTGIIGMWLRAWTIDSILSSLYCPGCCVLWITDELIQSMGGLDFIQEPQCPMWQVPEHLDLSASTCIRRGLSTCKLSFSL